MATKRYKYRRVCREYLYRVRHNRPVLPDCKVVFETNKDNQVTCGGSCNMAWSSTRTNERARMRRGTAVDETLSYVDVLTINKVTLAPLDGICPDEIVAYELKEVRDESDRLIGIHHSKVTYRRKQS